MPAYSIAPLLLGAALLAGCQTPPEATLPREVSIQAAKCDTPTYPADARRLEATGQTELEFEVNPDGKVTRMAIIKTSGGTPGHQALDAQALATFSKCVFPPAPGFLSGTGRLQYDWRLGP